MGLLVFVVLLAVVIAAGIALAPYVGSLLLWGVGAFVVLALAGWALEILVAIPDGLSWCWKQLRRGIKRT